MEDEKNMSNDHQTFETGERDVVDTLHDSGFVTPETTTPPPETELALKPPAKTVSTPVVIVLSVATLLIVGGGLFFLNRTLDRGLAQATPTPSVVATPTPIPLVVVTALPEPTLIPTFIPTPSIKPTPTPTPTPTPSPTPSPTPTSTLTLTSVSGQDGFRTSDGNGNATQDIQIGRNSTYMLRGFTGFDLAPLPKGSQIKKATLRLYQYKVNGAPYGVGGNIIVDNLDYGTTLNTDAYANKQAAYSNIETLSSSADVGWKELDVTNAVKADFSNHTSSQYRFRFSTEATGGDATGDVAFFYSKNSGYSTFPPQLVIQYY